MQIVVLAKRDDYATCFDGQIEVEKPLPLGQHLAKSKGRMQPKPMVNF